MKEYARTIQNMQGKFAAHGEVPLEMSIETTGVMSGYTLVPYYVELNEDMQTAGDGAVKPSGEKNYTLAQLTESDEAAIISSKEAEQWESYCQYVKKHDLNYPKEELSRLSEVMEQVKNGEKQIYLNEYINTYTLFPQQEMMVKGLLWEDTVYSLELEEVPEGEEFTEYFLFHQKKGFCVHYATAGTLMFRMMNIPARYVSGYVVKPSAFQQDSDGNYTAVVTDESAHAWTEVFEEGIGFYPVEVTPAAADAAQEEENHTSETEKENRPTEENNLTHAETEQQKDTEQQNQQQTEKENQNGQNVGTEDSGQTPGLVNTSGGQTNRMEIEKVWKTITILVAVTALCALVVFVVRWRRKYVNERKYRHFHQKNRRKAALALGRETYRILKEMGYAKAKKMTDLEYGKWLEQNLVLEQEMSWKEFVALQQQAAFSDKEISLAQWQKLLHLYENLKMELIRGKSQRLILYWKYVKILS